MNKEVMQCISILKCATLLTQMEAANVPALNRLPLEEARRAYQELGEQLGGVPVPVERIDDVNAYGPAGRLPLRVYRPKAAENWKVSALLAPALSGVAATLLAVGDRDPFHSEGMLYA